MPLKLQAPRPGKSPHYSIRGTYLGIYVDKSSGTSQREVAMRLLRKLKSDIERGAVAAPGEPTFAEAAINYMTSDGERRFLAPLINHFGSTALSAIDQSAVDRAAASIYPQANAATRNRQVYTPVSAVLKRAGIERAIRRPIGWRGHPRTQWLTPDQAFAIFSAVDKIEAPAETKTEFRILLHVLCYTGMRLGDALGLRCGNIDLRDQTALLPMTKNGKPRMVYLPKITVDELRAHPRGVDRGGRLFRFHNGGRLRDLLFATCDAAEVVLPDRVAFHIFRHTWATWMRRFGGLDTSGLVATQAWTDRRSAAQYEHIDMREESRKADLLPVPALKIVSA